MNIENIDKVVFTNHAISQFKLRWKKIRGGCLKKPERTALRLLKKAVENEIDSKHRLKRLLNNKMKYN